MNCLEKSGGEVEFLFIYFQRTENLKYREKKVNQNFLFYSEANVGVYFIHFILLQNFDCFYLNSWIYGSLIIVISETAKKLEYYGSLIISLKLQKNWNIFSIKISFTICFGLLRRIKLSVLYLFILLIP